MAIAPGTEDLTARARIRNAALHLFAERGIEGATIRDIAAAAGVSGGLVRHHFGSKDALRAVCDRYARGRIIEAKEHALLDDRTADPAFVVATRSTLLPVLQYLARSMMDGSPAADSMFDEMVDLTDSWLAEHHAGTIRDRRAYAAVLVAMELGSLALRDQLSRALGADAMGPDGLRMLRAKVDLYSNPLLTTEAAQRVHATIDRLQPAGERR